MSETTMKHSSASSPSVPYWVNGCLSARSHSAPRWNSWTAQTQTDRLKNNRTACQHVRSLTMASPSTSSAVDEMKWRLKLAARCCRWYRRTAYRVNSRDSSNGAREEGIVVKKHTKASSMTLAKCFHKGALTTLTSPSGQLLGLP